MWTWQGRGSLPDLDLWLVVPLYYLRGEVLKRQCRRKGTPDGIEVRAECV
jgi:hypothetical protein